MHTNDSKSRAGLPILMFANQRDFALWLAAQPAASKGLWLRLAKKGAAVATLTKAEAIDAALCHGWIDGQLDRYDDSTWLIRFTPRQRGSKWSEVNRTRALELIEQGLMAPAGLVQAQAARADGRWEAAYAPARTAEVPPDLQAALDAAPEAAAFFRTLTGANRYAVLYRISTAKKPETRSRRITQFVAMLARRKTIHSDESM